METLNSALPFLNVGIFVVSVAILLIVISAKRDIRRSLNLAERRVEYLREEQSRLQFLHEERRSLVEGLKRAQQGQLEAQRRAAETSAQKSLPPAEDGQPTHRQLLELRRQVENLTQDFTQLQREYEQLAQELERGRTQQQGVVVPKRERVIEGLRTLQELFKGRMARKWINDDSQ